jgi:DNA-binding response OmpR family regulator
MWIMIMMTSDRPRRQLRVLIIEDSRATADSLRLLLELGGHEARVAYDGVAGVRAAREWPPDVVLCDIGLPGLDGYGVAAALRDDVATAQARLIAVTAYSSEEHRRRSAWAGFERHFVKPMDPEELQALLRVLAREKAEAPAGERSGPRAGGDARKPHAEQDGLPRSAGRGAAQGRGGRG